MIATAVAVVPLTGLEKVTVGAIVYPIPVHLHSDIESNTRNTTSRHSYSRSSSVHLSQNYLSKF